MTSPIFGRVLTAMVTPMTPAGDVDEDAVLAVADHLLAHSHDGIVVNGTTGESATLTSDESIRVIELVAAHVGDRAVVVAAGEVPEDEDLEGELDILLGALAGRAIGDIDALTRCDRTDMIFHGCIN